MNPAPLTVEQATGLAGQMLGRAPGRIQRFRPRIGGDDSWSFRLWMDGRAMLLKVKKRPGTPVGVYFYRRVQQVGVPVPELIGFKPTGGPDGQAAAIWQWVDGEPVDWPAGEPCPYDEAEFGRLLRRVHDQRCQRPFGLLGDAPPQDRYTSHPDLGPASERWSGFFHCDRAARRYFGKGYLTRREANVLSVLPELLAHELDTAQPCLLHMGDVMHHGNMILQPGTGRILAILDYVESTAGDPRWELACMDYYFDHYPWPADFDMVRFRAAYGTDHDPGDRLGRFYLLAILVFEKLLFFDPASPRGRWAIHTVKGALRAFEKGA